MKKNELKNSYEEIDSPIKPKTTVNPMRRNAANTVKHKTAQHSNATLASSDTI